MIWLIERGEQLARLHLLHLAPNKYELQFADELA
jgi:hypothetical protein